MVAALKHETRDDAVELDALVVHRLARGAVALLAGDEAPKVLARQGELVGEQLELDTTDEVVLEPVLDAEVDEDVDVVLVPDAILQGDLLRARHRQLLHLLVQEAHDEDKADD